MTFGKEYYLIVLIFELATLPILLALLITRLIKTVRHVRDHSIKISPRKCLVPAVIFTLCFFVFLYGLLSDIGGIEGVVFPIAMILVGLFGIYSELGRSRTLGANAGKGDAGT